MTNYEKLRSALHRVWNDARQNCAKEDGWTWTAGVRVFLGAPFVIAIFVLFSGSAGQIIALIDGIILGAVGVLIALTNPHNGR